MLKYKNGYLTRNCITKEICQIVAKKHSLKPEDIFINWISRWVLVKYPTGLIAKAGKVKLWAVGFRPKTFFVHQNQYQKWYMR